MVAKVHGGVFSDQVVAGTLRAFVIGTANIHLNKATADAQSWTLANGTVAKFDTGAAVPDTAADIVLRLIASRATIVSVDFETDKMHVLLENASGWNDGSTDQKVLQTALQALGAAVPVSVVGLSGATKDFSAATAAQVRLLFDETAAVYTAGLGGNEHN